MIAESPWGRSGTMSSRTTLPPASATAATMKAAELKSAGTAKSAFLYVCTASTSNLEYPSLSILIPKSLESLSVASM